MMNNGMVGERLSALQRNMVEQRSDFVQAQTGLDTLQYGGEEAKTGAMDSAGMGTGIGGAVFDRSVSKIKNFILKRGKQALVDRIQPKIDQIKQSKADGTLGQQNDSGTQPPAEPEPPSSSTASGTAEDELFGNLPSTKAEAQQKLDDLSKQSGTPDTLEDDGGADFSTPKSLGGTQTKFQTGNLDTPSANLSQADTTLTSNIEGDATRSGKILRSFRATQTNTGDNIADAFRNDPSSNLFSQQTTTLQPQQQLQPSRPSTDPAPDPAPDPPPSGTTPSKPSTLTPETNELDTELASTKNALSDKAMNILKGAGVDTGDLSAEELASGLGGKAGELLGDTGSTILGRIGGFLGDAMDFLGPLGEIAGIGMSLYGAIEGQKEADAEENAKNQLAQVSAHINDMGGMSMGSMSLAPMDTETFRGGGAEGNF